MCCSVHKIPQFNHLALLLSVNWHGLQTTFQSIKVCSLLPLSSSSNCTCILRYTSPFSDLFHVLFALLVLLWPRCMHWSACLAVLSSHLHRLCWSQVHFFVVSGCCFFFHNCCWWCLASVSRHKIIELNSVCLVISQRIMQLLFNVVWLSRLLCVFSQTAITLKVIDGLHPGVTTVELDNLAAETAATMTTKHPDYAVLAARIAVSNLHKETKKVFTGISLSADI